MSDMSNRVLRSGYQPVMQAVCDQGDLPAAPRAVMPIRSSWSCHRCHSVHAPHVDTCPFCDVHKTLLVPRHIINAVESEITSARAVEATVRGYFIITNIERLVKAVRAHHE